MSTANTLRVAAAQFYVGADIEVNLASCLEWLERAATCEPDLVVLPEFCNHLSWYDDKQHAFDVSVTLDGPFLTAIAAKARELSIHVVVNCTVQREDGSATGSSLLYSPQGELLIDNTKQIYIGHENDFLKKAEREGPVIDSALGRVGLYACMDGVINETPRCLALNGAELMLNSLNSFATDEASLHIPVRAAENKVFVIAANKIGPLVPEAMMEAISAGTGIPLKFLNGAGESQVVAPDGTVLAKASPDQAEFIYADIDLSVAADKRRPDGTDVITSRRPELYAAISEDPVGQALPPMTGAAEVGAAVIQLAEVANLEAVRGEVDAAIAAGAERVVVGSTAAKDPDTVIGWFGELGPDCGVVGVDVTIDGDNDPVVQTHGWTESSDQTLWSLMDKFMAAGAYNFLCTDISKDGTLEGPNMSLYAECSRRYPKARVIASGGLSSAAEFAPLAATGVTSVVTGKALLDGRLTIEEIEQFLQNA